MKKISAFINFISCTGILICAGGQGFPSESAFAAPASKPSKPSVPAIMVQDESLPAPDKVIAVIEGEPLTMKDLKDYLKNSGLAVIPEEGSSDFKKYYDDFLMQALVEKEAKALNIEVSQDDLESYVQEVKRQNQVDDAQLVTLLAGKGMNLTTYKKQIQQEILRTRLTQQHARSTISISDRDVNDKLGVVTEENAGDLTRHVFQVFVPLEADGASTNYDLAETPVGNTEGLREQRLEIAQKIRDKVETADDLKSTSGAYFSDLGTVNADDLLPNLREALLDLDEGQVSDVIETERGFYIYGLALVKEQGPQIPDNDKENAKKQLFEEKLRTEMQSYINKELPKKYNLERKL